MNNKWISVKERLPTEEDTSDEFYNEVLTIQVGRKRPTWMKFWEIKDCPFTKYWMSVLPPTEEPNSISNESELSIDEIENVVSKGLDKNYYPNLPKKKYEVVSEDELVGVFAEIFGKHDRQITYNPQPLIALRNAKECAKIALQYNQSKLAELEKWIDEQEKKAETNGYFIYAPDLMDKLKSL